MLHNYFGKEKNAFIAKIYRINDLTIQFKTCLISPVNPM